MNCLASIEYDIADDDEMMNDADDVTHEILITISFSELKMAIFHCR